MSRKGKEPVKLPSGVEASVAQGKITVKGTKGTLEQDLHPTVDVNIADQQIVVTLKPEHKEEKSFHGLMRSLIQNMVTGVSTGFEKRLEMIGVGYRAAVKGSDLDLQIGVSHPVLIPIPKDINVSVEKNTNIVIQGADKQKIGQLAATIRATRPPEVYQGKGIRYSGEYVRKKAGKSAGK